MFLRKLTGMGVCAKMAHQIIPHTSPLKDRLQLVLDQSLNFSKIQATATGLITRGLGLQLQSSCNQWLVQSSFQSFEKP